jgi:hypothetical protein
METASVAPYTPPVRVSQVSVENYRSFVDRAKLELRPLTLLFGYNSAGKSAAIRLLPILAASASRAAAATLALDAEAARGASFRDILSRQSAGTTLAVGLRFAELQDTLKVEYVIRDLPERQVQIVERLQIESSAPADVPIEALWDTQLADSGSRMQTYDFRSGELAVGRLPMRIDGLSFEPPADQPFTPLMQRAAVCVRELAENVYWLNSLRAIPPRTARFGVRPKRLSSDGSNAPDFLAHDSLASGDLVKETSRWFERATGHRLTVSPFAVAGERHYALALAALGSLSALEIPIVDTGEGMAQVLPVIVLGSLARLGRLGRNALLAIEHPELHLHPAAHAELAAFFCSLTSVPAAPIALIETHSENFLLRVQLGIARGELSPATVVVHWIRGLEDGRSVVDTITFDDAARPQGAGWPPGVFAEDTEQAKALLRARRERGLA